MLSLNLVIVQLLGQLLLYFNLLVSLFQLLLQINQELWILHLLQSPPQLSMLLHQVGNCLIIIHNLLLRSLDSRRAPTLGSIQPCVQGSTQLLLLQRLLIHLLDQNVDIRAHRFQLFSQLSILILQELLLLVRLRNCLNGLIALLHLTEFVLCNHQGVFYEGERVSVIGMGLSGAYAENLL